MHTAPMVRIADIGQAADIKSIKAPSNIWWDYARVKMYVKEHYSGPIIATPSHLVPLS